MNCNRLEEARKERGLSVSEVCRKLDINRSTWYRWISGEHTPTIEKILKACSLMGIDVNDLLN